MAISFISFFPRFRIQILGIIPSALTSKANPRDNPIYEIFKATLNAPTNYLLAKETLHVSLLLTFYIPIVQLQNLLLDALLYSKLRSFSTSPAMKNLSTYSVPGGLGNLSQPTKPLTLTRNVEY